jgi:sigma-B regulation protein RsbU (phosphoserine phosphatase)
MATSHTTGISRETLFAREVQDRIFPAAHPSIPHLDYYSDWRRARDVGSDYLDYFEVDEGNLCVAIGDISGNGMRAALLASLHSIVRALRFSPAETLASFVASVDELFRGVCPDSCYATLFVGHYDPLSGRLRYVNAGHEPPFMLRKTGARDRIIRMESTGPMLGMLRHTRYSERSVLLAPGDLLVAHTDGLCEAVNPSGEEWGWRRLVEAIRSSRRERAREIVEQVLEVQDEFVEGAPQRDDMTIWIGRIEDAETRWLSRTAECEEPAAA